MLRRRGAFTLVEMMVVMAILGVLLGMSAAVFQSANRRYRFTASVAGVGTVVRSARNYSLARQSTSTVVVETTDGETTISALGQKQVASWHLEGDPNEESGGISLIVGGEKEHYGKFGACCFLAPGQTCNAGPMSRFRAREGVAISAWFYGQESEDARSVLFDFGKRLVVRWEDFSAVSATLAGAGEVRTPTGVFPPYRWVHVEVVYDRTRLAIYVDGVLQASEAATEPLEPSDAPFQISDKKESFAGLVDEVTIGIIVRPESQPLPDDVAFVGGPRRVYFDRQGQLDRTLHPGPVEMWFYSKDKGVWRQMKIGRIGRVTITEVSEGGPELPKPKKSETSKGGAGSTKAG